MRGIDISNWQEGLNVHNLDIDFCICKATEGVNFVDTTCDSFIQQCKDKNILWAFYHYARENNPEDEAQFFYDNCKDYIKKGIPVLDYETENYNNAEWCERFINKFHELSGIWCIIYISASRCPEYGNSWIPEKCGLWVAGYPTYYTQWPVYKNEYGDISHYIDKQTCNNDYNVIDMPYDIKPWEFAAIWQFTDCLIINGFWEKLDGDIAYMDENAWMKYAQSTDNPQNEEKGNKSQKSIDDLVLETLLGEYGNNEDRKRMLGDKYNEVQERINKYYDIAKQVIDGKWGNGWNRQQALNGAGYPYEIIQKIVNDMLA